MSKATKFLRAMRENPQGDWRTEDVQAICRAHGVDCYAPKRGSHYVVSHAAVPAHLTIPSRRPIKPVYIRLLVAYLDDVRAADA